MCRNELKECSKLGESFYEDLCYCSPVCDECNSVDLRYIRTASNGNVYKCKNCNREIITKNSLMEWWDNCEKWEERVAD